MILVVYHCHKCGWSGPTPDHPHVDARQKALTGRCAPAASCWHGSFWVSKDGRFYGEGEVVSGETEAPPPKTGYKYGGLL